MNDCEVLPCATSPVCFGNAAKLTVAVSDRMIEAWTLPVANMLHDVDEIAENDSITLAQSARVQPIKPPSDRWANGIIGVRHCKRSKCPRLVSLRSLLLCFFGVGGNDHNLRAVDLAFDVFGIVGKHDVLDQSAAFSGETTAFDIEVFDQSDGISVC